MLHLAKHIDDEESEKTSVHSNSFHTFVRSYGIAVDEKHYSKTFRNFTRMVKFMVALIFILALAVYMVSVSSINKI